MTTITLNNVHGPQDIFGSMVKIAAPIIQCFHSDLYYDATQLESIWTDDAFTVWWSVSPYGTHMSTDWVHWAAIRRVKSVDTQAYEIVVGAEQGSAGRTVTFQKDNNA